MPTQPQPDNSGALLVALLIAAGGWFVMGSKADAPRTPNTGAVVVTVSADVAARIAKVRELGKRNPVAAKRLAILLAAAATSIRDDVAVLKTTEHLFKFVERAETLFITGGDGVNALPGIGAAVSDVLRAPDVCGSSVAPLEPGKRKAAADALQSIADALRG